MIRTVPQVADSRALGKILGRDKKSNESPDGGAGVAGSVRFHLASERQDSKTYD
jgi:hypothetical protein